MGCNFQAVCDGSRNCGTALPRQVACFPRIIAFNFHLQLAETNRRRDALGLEIGVIRWMVNKFIKAGVRAFRWGW